MISGVPMQIFKWSSSFQVFEEPSIILVWVSFPNFLVYFLKKCVLFSMAMVVGRPLKLDAAATYLCCPSVARFVFSLIPC